MVASEQPDTVIRDALSRTTNYTDALLGNRKFRRDPSTDTSAPIAQVADKLALEFDADILL